MSGWRKKQIMLTQPKELEQEPVGWVDDGGTVFWKDKPPADGADLYTSPPASKPWRGLTDEEIIIMSRYDLEYAALIGEVQRKLKEKNTNA